MFGQVWRLGTGLGAGQRLARRNSHRIAVAKSRLQGRSFTTWSKMPHGLGRPPKLPLGDKAVRLTTGQVSIQPVQELATAACQRLLA